VLERGKQIIYQLSRTTWVDLDSKLIHPKTRNELGRKEKGQKEQEKEGKSSRGSALLPNESENSIPCKSSFWG
jgi:hypothetical protein